MKIIKISLVAALMLMMAGCTNERVVDVEGQGNALVTVRVGGFSISQKDISGTRGSTRAVKDAAEYAGVKALTLAFYKGNTEAYKVTQLKASLEEGETFGEFSLSLPMGNYTMVVLGHGLGDGEPAVTLTSPTVATFGDYPARETFVATQAVKISNTDSVDVSATLKRIVSKLHVESTDVRTAGVSKVRMTFAAGSKSF